MEKIGNAFKLKVFQILKHKMKMNEIDFNSGKQLSDLK